MKSVWGRRPVTSTRSIHPAALARRPTTWPPRSNDEPHDERPQRLAEQRATASHQCQAERGDRDELGSENHRPDDQHLRVQDDRHARDERGQTHEAQVRPVEFGVLVRPLRDVDPDDGVGAAARRSALGFETTPGQPRLHRFDLYGARLVDPEVAKAIENLVGAFAGHVGQDHITLGHDRRPGQHRQAAHGRISPEQLLDLVRQLTRGRDSQTQHDPILAQAGRARRRAARSTSTKASPSMPVIAGIRGQTITAWRCPGRGGSKSAEPWHLQAASGSTRPRGSEASPVCVQLRSTATAALLGAIRH